MPVTQHFSLSWKDFFFKKNFFIYFLNTRNRTITDCYKVHATKTLLDCSISFENTFLIFCINNVNVLPLLFIYRCNYVFILFIYIYNKCLTSSFIEYIK